MITMRFLWFLWFCCFSRRTVHIMEICFYKMECSQISCRNFQAVQQASNDKWLYLNGYCMISRAQILLTSLAPSSHWRLPSIFIAPPGVQNEISNVFVFPAKISWHIFELFLTKNLFQHVQPYIYGNIYYQISFIIMKFQ